MIFLIKGELMIKKIYTQLRCAELVEVFLHDRISSVNTIVFTHTLGIIKRNFRLTLKSI